jgi:hypothetical protein
MVNINVNVENPLMVLQQLQSPPAQLTAISAASLFSFTAPATEPPAESWQNSYRPSNTGQSSPTLTKRRENESGLLMHETS